MPHKNYRQSQQKLLINKRPVDEESLSFLSHVRELRKRVVSSIVVLLLGFIVTLVFYDEIVNFLMLPFDEIAALLSDKQLYIHSLTEGFTTKIKIAFLSSVVFTLPFHVFQLVQFILPGLYTHERRLLKYILLASTLLVLAGTYLSFFKLIPYSIRFLMSAGFVPEDVGILLNYNKNIFYVFQIFLFSIIVFQTPIVLELLLIMNLIKRQTLFKASRYVIVLIFIFSAIITPPDPITQLGISLPLIVLFYLTLLLAKIFKFGEG